MKESGRDNREEKWKRPHQLLLLLCIRVCVCVCIGFSISVFFCFEGNTEFVEPSCSVQE